MTGFNKRNVFRKSLEHPDHFDAMAKVDVRTDEPLIDEMPKIWLHEECVKNIVINFTQHFQCVFKEKNCFDGILQRFLIRCYITNSILISVGNVQDLPGTNPARPKRSQSPRQ